MAQRKRSIFGNRGKEFEALLEQAHEFYRVRGFADIDHNPTASKHIGKRVIQVASTVDFSGVIAPDGRAIYFDAKETQEASLPLRSIHAHQIRTITDKQRFGAIAGLMIRFVGVARQSGRIFFVPAFVVQKLWDEGNWRKGRKSISQPQCEEHGVEVPAGKIITADWWQVKDRMEVLCRKTN